MEKFGRTVAFLFLLFIGFKGMTMLMRVIAPEAEKIHPAVGDIAHVLAE